MQHFFVAFNYYLKCRFVCAVTKALKSCVVAKALINFVCVVTKALLRRREKRGDEYGIHTQIYVFVNVLKRRPGHAINTNKTFLRLLHERTVSNLCRRYFA